MYMSGVLKRPMYGLSMIAAGALLLGNMSASPKPVARDNNPWFEAKSVCLFRLGTGPMPQTSDELSDALQRGWSQAIRFPDPAAVISMEQPGFPSIGALKVNLSDGQLKITDKKDRIKLNNVIERELQIGKLEIRGEPLLVRKARIHMNLNANSAQLVLERDRVGRPVAMLQDAASGNLAFDVSVADAEALMLHNARDVAVNYGVTVESMHLKIVAETPRSLQVSLHVATLVGFIPAGMLFKAHVNVDDGMNAKITGISIDGDDALGPLIVGLLRPALVKHNNETRPLVGFPAGKLQLRDVAVRVDDSLHLTAAFGS
ncbi:MAG TPA: hypothetical protein VIM11_25120 [Tepidisphaeraceae bacterium]|jgi:hypothetical protein